MPRPEKPGFFIAMTQEEKMAIVIEAMEDRSLPNRPSCRVKRMKEMGLDVSHDEMLRLWKLYRHEATTNRYIGYVPHERPW